MNKNNFFLSYNNVPRGTLQYIESYLELLVKWNKKINLISKSQLEQIWNRHIFDSLQLLNYISNEKSIVDLGSGSGFPGMILSYAGIKQTHLIESDCRKAKFLECASQISPNSVYIYNKRAENINNIEADILVVRAFSNILSILQLLKNIKINNKILLLKGKSAKQELNECLAKNMKIQYNLYRSQTSDDSYIVEIFSWKF